MNTFYDEIRLNSVGEGRVGFWSRGKNWFSRGTAKIGHLTTSDPDESLGNFGKSNLDPRQPTSRHKSKSRRANINYRSEFWAQVSLYARLMVTIGLVGLTMVSVLRNGAGTDASVKSALISGRSKLWARKIASSEIPVPVAWAPDHPPRTVTINSTQLVSASVNGESTFAKGSAGMSGPNDTDLEKRASTQPPPSPPAASKPTALKAPHYFKPTA